MFQRTYQKKAVQVLLLIVVIYVLIKLLHHTDVEQIYMFNGQFFYSDRHQRSLFKYNNETLQGLTFELDLGDKQQPKLPSKKIQDTDEKQRSLLHRKVNCNDQQQIILPPEFDWHLVQLSDNKTKFNKYVQSLSAFRVKDLIRQMGISNLTLIKAQKQFLQCTGFFLLSELKGKNPSPPICIPKVGNRCKHLSFKDSGPVVALSSFQGSGNSWVRQLLESATGIYTGSVYDDLSYVKAGMIGEYINTNNVLVVKIHGSPFKVKEVVHNNKAIYIVRNPFGVLLSENNRNTLRLSKLRNKNITGNTHLVEVDFNYGEF